ncbi:uncharacterized protein LOC123204273 isoform X1 [Mangifera indica]|uniref:uncharacterized protein LOC123204273 isoform X1 n=1 Tax=Mangifera indica TaxID=29780 RepID=UPI001CF9B42F|nr:uncharacterized protein LOC123204273 isoform X1 [Mangifera indica]
MDFHTLTRKELQTLCKKNKIPANIANGAMADALSALEFVEGLDEFMNQSHSPEKTTQTESATIPRTANRTSTRRKPIKEDPETVQPMTRTRRATRKTLEKDFDQENQNLNVGETPVVKDNAASRRKAPAASASKKTGSQVKDNVGREMSCVVETETPMMQAGRRKATQMGSTRRKLEESIQRVYSTRRSVRLLEKTLADLSLKDEVMEEPVKMDVMDETGEKDVSEVSLEANNDSEFSSGVIFLKSLENERGSEEGCEEDKSNESGEEDCNLGTQNSVNMDNVSVLVAEDDNHDETSDASDKLPVENSNEIEPVDIPETESLSEADNTSIKVMEPEEPLADEKSDKISSQVVEDVVPEDQFVNSGKNSEADTNQSVTNSIASPMKKQMMEPEGPLAVEESDKISAQVVEDAVQEDHFVDSGKRSEADTNQCVTNSVASPLNKQFAVECVEKESVHLDNVVATYKSDGPNVETDNVMATNMQIPVECVLNMQVPFECFENESVHLDLDNVVATDSSNGPDVETDNEFESDNATYNSDNPNAETDDELVSENNVETYSSDYTNDETDNESSSDDELVDVQLTEVEAPISSVEGSVDVNLIGAEVPTSDDIEERFDAEGTKEAEVSYENKTPKSVKQIDSISGDQTPFGADSISGQFPRPTRLTPMRSSNKRHATAQELTLPACNKENIDSIGFQLESKKDKAKKDKSTTDEDSLVKSLQKKSLRELNKMLREKLIITNKNRNNDGQNVAKTRPALQALPENVMAPADPNKEH